MEQALQNYERATKEAMAELRAAREAEKQELSRKHQELEEDRTRLELQAAEGRRALAADRAALTAEIAGVEGRAVRPADRVRLNVGGRHFETTRRTLTAARETAPESWLGTLGSGRHEGRLPLDGEGRIFVDRDGALFEGILEFLRGCSTGDGPAAVARIRALPATQRQAMREELDYYGLQSAVCPAVPSSTHLAAFSPGPILSKRNGFGAVVLPENRGVLVVGGHSGRNFLASSELLNLDTEICSPGPFMESRRWRCGTAVLEDGRVVVVGGYDGTDILSTTEVLDPATNTWSPGPTLTSRSYGCAALPVSNDRILVIGGRRHISGKSYLSTTEIVDLTSGASTPGPAMSCPRGYHSAVLLQDGRVLVIGGTNSTHRSLSTTEILDLTRGTSSPGPGMEAARHVASVTLLPDGSVLIIGGKQQNGTDLATTEVLDVAGNTTSAGPELGIPRSYCAAVKLPGDLIMVIGGSSEGTTVSTSEMLAISTIEETKP